MAIKRLTIELDDASDNKQSTSLPASLVKEKDVSIENHPTGTPEQQNDYHTPELMDEGFHYTQLSDKIGKTPSDLVFHFINRHEFMATILTFLAFVIFAAKIQKLADLWLPVLASVIMNIVWFGVQVMRRLMTKVKS